MTTTTNPVDDFYRVYNEHNLDLWDEITCDSYVGHVNEVVIPNRDVGKGFIAGLMYAFPDLHYTVEDRITEGNRVVARWKAVGTHKGELQGMPPTNKTVTMIGISVFQVEQGKIAQLWSVWDQHGLVRQLTAE